MKFRELEIPGPILVEPDVHGDERGFFLETWHAEKYAAGGIDADFVQDNHSHSARHVLRGLHAQLEPAMGKLVRTLAGGIWDVAVDVRVGSPHFGRHAAATLSGTNHAQLWIPPGFLHGFCVLTESADIAYKCTALYAPDGEIAVAWDDPELAIPWPCETPALSERDREAPRLAALRDRLPHFEGETR